MTRSASRLLAVLTVVAATAGVPAAQQGDLGTIDFPTSGAASAQPAFIKGVLLLHSFEYADAREAFQEAQAADPGFAMAYWGEAMTHNHPVWQEVSVEEARAALARLAPSPEARLAKAPTAKEKDWLASLDVLYGPGEKPARDAAYADALLRMHERYPADNEVAAFAALAVLGTSHAGRDVPTYIRAAAIAEQVFARNPQHPGAAHYLIHAYDDPVHAPLGRRFAEAYSRVAPASAHALHMPSHIYFALGLWDEAATMNERSMKAADARVAARKLDADGRGLHAMLWLVYGYAQQGRYEEARGILGQLEADAASSGSVRTRSHLALARAAWLIETRKWGEAKAPVPADGLGRSAAMAELFAVGLAAVRSGNRAGTGNALQRMAELMEEAPVNGAPVRPAGGTTAPGGAAGADLRVAQVMAQQLEAMLLFSEGRRGEALVLARQAAVVEEGLPFEFGPPMPVKPAHELVGEILLDLRQPREAMQAFELSLKRHPKRALSLLGLGRAATLARDPATAKRAFGELQQVWKRADKNLPELKEIGALRPASSH